MQHMANRVPKPPATQLARLRRASNTRARVIARPRQPRYGRYRQDDPAMTETHFGFQQVPLAEKQALVDDVFDRVARRYDLMNDLMTGGLHRAWKADLVTALNPPKDARPFQLVDVAGGTGDIAFRVVDASGPVTRVTVIDINPEMLTVGHERAVAGGRDDVVSFVTANAEKLPPIGATIFLIPLKLGKGTGGPTRAFALLP